MSGPAWPLLFTTPVWKSLRAEIHARGHRIPAGAAFRSAWACTWFTMAWRMRVSTAQSLPPGPDPHFVLGFWRSGTTFLHELLALDPRFSYAPTSLCMNPALDPALVRKGRSIQRPMDGLTISTESPQEDEFALLAAGAPSFYRNFVAPAGWQAQLRLLDPDRLSAEEERDWQQAFDTVRKLATALFPDGGRTLLLKSPNHSFRLDRLARRHAGSRFILIVRDSRATLRSTYKLWRSMYTLYAREPWEQVPLARLSAEAYGLFVDRTLASLPAMAAGRLVALRYEDLAANPEAVVGRLYARLGWEHTPELRQSLSAECARRQGHVVGSGNPKVSGAEPYEAQAAARHQQLLAGLENFWL